MPYKPKWGGTMASSPIWDESQTHVIERTLNAAVLGRGLCLLVQAIVIRKIHLAQALDISWHLFNGVVDVFGIHVLHLIIPSTSSKDSRQVSPLIMRLKSGINFYLAGEGLYLRLLSVLGLVTFLGERGSDSWLAVRRWLFRILVAPSWKTTPQNECALKARESTQ